MSLISETKLDDSFPTAQLTVKGFSAPYRFDRNSTKVDGLLLFNEGSLTRNLYCCFIKKKRGA